MWGGGNASSVEIKGSFDGWDTSRRLQQQPDATWAIAAYLSPGMYQVPPRPLRPPHLATPPVLLPLHARRASDLRGERLCATPAHEAGFAGLPQVVTDRRITASCILILMCGKVSICFCEVHSEREASGG